VAFVAYRTWTTGEIPTAAMLNQDVRDNGNEGLPAKVTAVGQIPYGSGTSPKAISMLAAVASGQVLRSAGVGVAPVWGASTESLVTAQGDTLYATGAGVLARLPKGTAGQVLQMNAGATAPEWGSGNPPTCRAKHSANISIADTVDTYLPFDGEDFDTESMHNPASNNSRITITTPGVYYVFVAVRLQATATYQVQVRKNRTTPPVLGGNVHYVPSATFVYVNGLVKLAAADYVEVFVQQSGGGALNVQFVDGCSPLFGAVWVATG
jgi:hypothetical protein